MSTTPLDGRPLSNTPRVADLQATDLVPLVRLSEPLPEDQNVHMRADRLQELLGGGGGTLPPSPGVTLYDALGAHTDGAATQRLVTEVANRPGNAARIPLKVVATYADLLALDPLTCCLGTEAPVLLPAPGEAARYVLKYVDHAFAWAYVCQDGNFDQNNLSDGQWIAVDSPRAGLQDYTKYPAGYAFPAGTFVAAYVAGQTTEQIFKRRAPGGPASAPVDGGDPTEWELASLTDVPKPNPASFQELTGDPRDNVALADALAEFATQVEVDALIAASAARAAPVSVLTPSGLVGYGSLDAALVRTNPAAIALTLNTALAALAATQVTNAAWPAFFNAAGSSITVNDGVTVKVAGSRLDTLVVQNAFFFKQNATASTAQVLVPTHPILATDAATCGVFENCSSEVPLTLASADTRLVLRNGHYVSVGGAGTVYLYGSVGVDSIGAGVTVVDRRPQALAGPDPLAYAATVALDFAAAPRRTLSATGNVAFTTTGRTTAGAEKTVRVTNATGAAITLSYEAWTVYGMALPTSLPAGKTMILTLTCYGTSVSDVDAAAVLAL